MNTGTFAEATLHYTDPRGDLMKWKMKLARMQVHSSGFTEITYYDSGVRRPENKRTLIMPTTSVMEFRADGYAGSMKELTE